MLLKIIHTAATYPPNVDGVSNVIRTVSEGLALKGHRVTVATERHPQRNYERLNHVEIKQFDILGNQVSGYLGDIRRYIDFIRSFKSDVILNYAAEIWTSDLVFPMLDTLKCVKIFAPCGFSQMNSAAYSKYYKQMPEVLKKYDHTVYHSEMYQDRRFSDLNNIHNYSIIPNGALESEFEHTLMGFRREYDIDLNNKMFLCVANYDDAKNQELVLQAYQKASIQDSTLVFIGSSFNKYLWEILWQKAKLTGSCGIISTSICKLRRHLWHRLRPVHSLRAELAGRRNILFLEQIPRNMVVSAYHEADLFVYGSRTEVFPLVILEAMASKTPFITTDCGNVRELPGGVVVTSVDDMAERMRELAMKGHDWRSLAEAGRRAWEKKYRWERIVDQYEQLYLTLSSGKGARS